MIVTIIIPCFNEKNTICELVEKVLKQKIKKQIILIDDCSNDGTQYLIKKKLMNKVSHVIFNKKNIGKGGCIQAAKKFVKGDIIIIQDADLEYDPHDYKKLLDPFKKEKANVSPMKGMYLINDSRIRRACKLSLSAFNRNPVSNAKKMIKTPRLRRSDRPAFNSIFCLK